MAMEALKNLRDFEKQKEQELEKTQATCISEVEKARNDIDKRLKEEKEMLEKKKESEIEKTKKDAMEKAKNISAEYKEKVQKLKKSSSKNSEKAVDKIFSMILNENV